MNRQGPYRKLVQTGLITLAGVLAVIGITYLLLNRWENRLIQGKKALCEVRAGQIAGQVEREGEIQALIAPLLQGDSIQLGYSRRTEEVLTDLVKKQVEDVEGLEGGFYILGLDDFIGYAYPTSEPPVPVYGPPPRSYHIIRDQVLASIETGKALSDLHAFDPAVFPLATHPFRISGQTAGAVWVRIHIERDLLVARLRRVLFAGTVIFGVGFLVMALFTLFLRSGIRNIQKELASTRTDPGYRLKLRGGLFGFIPRQINEMLDLIAEEYRHRMELEKQLHHKEKLAALGRMIAGVAHEVGTPLSVIKTRLQMWETALEKHQGEGKVMEPEAMNMVINEINRVSELMKRLVVFSRPINEHLAPTRVNGVIEEVLSMMDFENPGKQVRIIRQLEESPHRVSSDPNSLKQVLINILTNAMESLGEAGEIAVRSSFDPEVGIVTISISDNGPGIDEGILDRIFEPFYTTRETGTGLGLAISREIILSYGGDIGFRKNAPRGSICFITLPLINELNGKHGD